MRENKKGNSSMLFEASGYGPRFAEVLAPERLNALGPGAPNEQAASTLHGLDVAAAFAGLRVTDNNMAQCCLAGVWLLHDFLDESHALSQGVETTTGSYWHGIMHRREPDYSNAKYWFRRVGEHPVFEDIQRETQVLATNAASLHPEAIFLAEQQQWDPFRFIDLCETAARNQVQSQQETVELCRHIAQAEWRVLFDYCFAKATR